MQVTQTPTQLRVTAVRAEHAGVLLIAVGTLLVATYLAGELTRFVSTTYGVDEGVLPLMLIIYLILPVMVSRMQRTRFSPLFRIVVIPAVSIIQAAFAIYRQSSIVFNGDEYVFDLGANAIEHNGDSIGKTGSVEAVELYRNTFPTIGDTFNIKLLMRDGERVEVGFAVRSEREAKRISERIARFLDVPRIDCGEFRERAETIGSRYRHPERYESLGGDGTDPDLVITAADFDDNPPPAEEVSAQPEQPNP